MALSSDNVLYKFIDLYGGDAFEYWLGARAMSANEFWLYMGNISDHLGTALMVALNYLLANALNMSFWQLSLLYGLLGFVGFIFFYHLCQKSVPKNTKILGLNLFPLILFLPNLHFWAVGVGKDTLSFLCIVIFAYGTTNLARWLPLMVVSLVLLFAVRPHVALMLMASFVLVYLLDAKKNALFKIVVALSLALAVAAILSRTMEYANINSGDISGSSEEFVEKGIKNLSGPNVGSATDLASLPYPLRLLSFLYRPLFFDITSPLALIVSVENLLLLFLSVRLLKCHPIRSFRSAPIPVRGLFIFFVLGTAMFSAFLSNLGITLRMRNMLLPGIILFMLWVFSQHLPLRLRLNAGQLPKDVAGSLFSIRKW